MPSSKEYECNSGEGCNHKAKITPADIAPAPIAMTTTTVQGDTLGLFIVIYTTAH